MENRKAGGDQSFRIEDLLNGKISKENFQISYLGMYKMLDELERKHDRIKVPLTNKIIWEAIYDFGVITTGLEKADFQTRIDDLNEQNLKWFTKADTLDTENRYLKNQLAELKAKYDVKEFTLPQQPGAEGVEIPTETNQEIESNPQ